MIAATSFITLTTTSEPGVSDSYRVLGGPVYIADRLRGLRGPDPRQKSSDLFVCLIHTMRFEPIIFRLGLIASVVQGPDWRTDNPAEVTVIENELGVKDQKIPS